MRETEFVGDVNATMEIRDSKVSKGDEHGRRKGNILLIGAVNEVVRVRECALDGEDGRVSSLLPRSVVTAGVTALGLHVRNRKVFLNQSLVELCQLGVGEVRDDPNFLPSSFLHPGSHVELTHGDNLDAAGLVVVGNGLGTQKSGFLNISLSFAGDEESWGRTSAEYQWNSTVRLGLKSDSNRALYASRMVTLPLPSSSAP
jgi:hypothetical protein